MTTGSAAASASTEAPVATDPLTPLREADRRARRTAAATVAGTLAGMAAAATIPLWSDEERLRPVLSAADVRQAVHWEWDLAPHDGWWAFALVLLAPCLAAAAGAVVTRRRLTRAAGAAPFRARPGQATAGAGRITAAQRRARERGRSDDLRRQQQYAVARERRAVSVWTHLGGAFALVLGTWFGTALAVSALGLRATPVGIGLTVASWWVVLVPLALWGVVVAVRRVARPRR
ncbi:hypothetical protein [Cellulomonas shaoxiangyii]|uniref:Uncharacterized protein n=1 Tax=Cellulomonas shaoxiangyii TaxID=2566013 RepID=A0A4P7SPY2_9CELL|nr:hypothetical protein [Cellulomonas shaoxiangyii]QCB94803.1 hypothetical protein E5225_15780 [Cellulomonas shaoxiangyii]TGY86533.1 hypothetical protein E5226_01805 [Cellulomonas shaoxiangyii]